MKLQYYLIIATHELQEEFITKINVLVTARSGAVFMKEYEMPFVPSRDTELCLTIGGTDHILKVEKVSWEEKRNLIFVRVDGSKMTESRFPIKDKPNFYFDNDPTWRRNY